MRLHWDGTAEKVYNVGVDRGVLFTLNPTTNQYDPGVPWNGISAVNENPSGAEPTKVYADNLLYANILSAEEYAATIEAFYHPREFYACNGMKSLARGVYTGQQTRQKFGFSFRTKLGNDVTPEAGYKIHLVYNCLASPSSEEHNTTNESPDINPMSWEVNAEPVGITDDFSNTAHLIIDSTECDADKLTAFEKILYGDDVTATAFSSSATYDVGDYVTYETKTYRCVSAVTVAGEFNSANWTEVDPQSVGASRLPLPAEVMAFFAEG